jgi:F0F1-type ATP synthase assembly protein I
MKPLLALVTLALAILVVEDKARQVANDAQHAYGEAVVQARDASQSLSQTIKKQPLAALLVSGVVGYLLGWFIPQSATKA